jgi:hypothetical protein
LVHLAAGTLAVLLTTACGTPSRLIGRWRPADRTGSLVVYPDGKVSVFGVQCRWVEVDHRTVRIQDCLSGLQGELGLPLLPFDVAADLRLTTDLDHANLDVGFLEIELERVQN